MMMQTLLLSNLLLLCFSWTTAFAEEDIIQVHQKVLEEYRITKSSSSPRQSLEKAGIKSILNSKPETLTEDQYINILNDYAFFVSEESYMLENLKLSVDLLERVIKISPQRAVAHLNIADAYRNSIKFLDGKEQVRTAEKADEHYRIYRKLTKKKLERAEQFLAFNPSHQSKFKSVCYYVAAIKNSNRMREFSFQGEEIDIDNDGQLDKVDMGSPGTLKVKFGEKQTTESVPYYAEGEIDIISFQGTRYVVHSYGNRLIGVKKITDHREDAQEGLCGFEQKVTRKVLESSLDSLCKSIQRGKELDYSQYDKPHAYAWQPSDFGEGEGGFAIVAGEGSCDVDIDNDGRPEPVVPLNFSHGRGNGCSFTFLAILNKTRNGLAERSRTTESLFDLQGVGPNGPLSSFDVDNCDGLIYKTFRWNNGMFIEGKVEGAYKPFHEIFQIKGGTLRPICKFEVQIENVVR